jgi:hypothetical protein
MGVRVEKGQQRRVGLGSSIREFPEFVMEKWFPQGAGGTTTGDVTFIVSSESEETPMRVKKSPRSRGPKNSPPKKS